MLTEAIEELKKEIELADKREAGEPEEEAVIEPEKAEEKPADKVEELEAKPEVKEEVKVEPKEEIDNAGFARLRREAAADKKRADAAEAKAIALEAKLSVPDITEETGAPEVSPEVASMLEDHRFKRAEREFQSLESEFSSKQKDYEGVSAEYAMALASSIRIQNPRMSVVDVAEETKKSLLMKAAKYMKDGFNPIEELYHEAKDLGFTGNSYNRKPEPKEEAKVEKEEVIPDMKKLAANRAKSSGMTVASGKSEGQMTKQAASDLPVGEWLKIPLKERQRIMAS